MKNLIKKIIVKLLLRPVCEALGIPKYCRRPSLNNLDDKLSKYLNFRHGVFVEAGGNDGISQSNTFFLEKGLRWQGVLVEAIPELYTKCKKNRSNARVFHGALVANDYDGETLRMQYANLMSIAEGSMGEQDLKAHVKEGLECQHVDESYSVDVRVLTFDKVLTEAGVTKIDFMSLDLEGYEAQAMRGMNFDKFRPRYILIEVRDLVAMDDFLAQHDYCRIEKLTVHDYLYRDQRDLRE